LSNKGLETVCDRARAIEQTVKGSCAKHRYSSHKNDSMIGLAEP